MRACYGNLCTKFHTLKLQLELLVCERPVSVNVIDDAHICWAEMFDRNQNTNFVWSSWSDMFPHCWDGMSTFVSPHCWNNNVRQFDPSLLRLIMSYRTSLEKYIDITALMSLPALTWVFEWQQNSWDLVIQISHALRISVHLAVHWCPLSWKF